MSVKHSMFNSMFILLVVNSLPIIVSNVVHRIVDIWFYICFLCSLYINHDVSHVIYFI